MIKRVSTVTNNGQKVLFRVRQLSQLLILGGFFVLFLKTDYNGTDYLETAVNLLFRLDPFLAACVMVGIKAVVLLFLPALFVLLLTLVFNRSFCGWFCPMGTLLDLFRRTMPAKPKNSTTVFPRLPLLIFVVVLVCSIFGFSLAGYVDPFSLLVRAMVQIFYPALNALTVAFFSFTYADLPAAINRFTEPFYSLLQATVLPSSQKYFQLTAISFFLLLGIFLLERVQRRFFCRNICPLGAMLGLVSRMGFLTGKGGNADCGACRLCANHCRMGAIDEERIISKATCNLCFQCVKECPRSIISFAFALPRQQAVPVSLSRRTFIGAAAAGMLLPSLKAVDVLAKNPDPLLIRPPGALAEKEFLSRCVRCAECLQVCIGNALQPTFLQAGIDGIFSPVLVAKTGYCEFNCTLCGQVCPTGAIRLLSLAEKQKLKIGHAFFDKNTCLPFAKATPCMVCEEHCPTPQKAIRFKEETVIDHAGSPVVIQQPYVVDELCIGCGICENKCPLPGKAAIYVTSGGEDRHPGNALPYPGQKSPP